MSQVKIGDTVYSLDDLQHGYHEEATITEIHEHDGRPDWAPSRTYTLTLKNGSVLGSMMRGEFTTKKPPASSPFGGSFVYVIPNSNVTEDYSI